MLNRKRTFTASALFLFAMTFGVPAAEAKPSEYDKIVSHLTSMYRAKKINVGFMWLARLAVKVVRPAGVKSFNATLFENLNFSRDTLDVEMQAAMRESFGPEWSSIFRVRSREGQQAYMYMREDGKNIKLTVVTIDKNQAAVIRAKFSLEKLADFINDPKIFGISLSDKSSADKDSGQDEKEKVKSVDPPMD